MKKGIRLLSLLLAVCMLLAGFEIGIIANKANAICCCKDNFDKSRYTLTGNMAHDVAMIAKSQKGRTCDDFGYSGVDYGKWCDEYVADCIENAGADDSIVAHGGTVSDFESKMRARGAVTVSSPQEGDLVFFASHVEIVTRVEDGIPYCAGGNNGSNPGSCKGERKVSSVGSVRLYMRPNYRNAEPPTWANLTIDKNEVNTGEEFTFTMSSDQPVSYYWFTICRASNGEVILSESTDGTFSTSFLSCDHYYAWCSAANSAGSVDSNRVDFYVFDYAPTEAKNSVNKNVINLGESITVTTWHNAYYARIYTSVFCDDEAYYSGWQENTYTFTPTKTGFYAVNTSAYTPNGTAHAGWCSFRVVDPNQPCSHIWNDGEVTAPATCVNDGVMTYACTICGKTKTELIPAVGHNDENKDGICDVCETVLVPTPTVPAGVTAKATGDKQITVSYNLLDGATQYNIYRYNSTKKAYVYKGTTFAAAAKPTQYVDSGLNAGTTYYYKVVAVTKTADVTLVSDMSAAASAKAVAAPAVPTGVAVKATADKALTVSWAAVSGATQYNVYRYNGTKKEYVYKGTTFATTAKPTQYVDTGLYPGTTYYYKVVAVTKDAGLTLVSAQSAAANAKVVGTPAVPTGVAVKPTANKTLTISWSAVKNATQYNIYRYNGTSKTYVYKGTTFATAANPTQYVDTGLYPGTTYYYKVVAVTKEAGLTLVSAQSSAASAKALGTPAVPDTVTATGGTGKVTLLWTESAGATQYNIYRYNGTKKEYVYKGTSYSTSYTDTTVVAGTTYYYKVVPVTKGAGLTLVGAYSAAVSAKAK